MSIDLFLKTLLQEGLLSEDDAINSIAERCTNINEYNYNSFIALCKKHQITDESFFMRVYLNASERIQYQLWKDKYVNSCPVSYLIDAIVSEDANIIKQIHNDYDTQLQHCEAHFENIQDTIIYRISQARINLKIAMAWFTNPYIFNAISKACKRGVDVQLLINNDLINNRPNGLPFDRLIEDGANLFIAEPPSFIHNKFCIIDDKSVIDGSYNWTILAETNNDENIVIIDNGDVINSFLYAFDRLIRNNTHVGCMPDRVPERQEYDCCSYKNYNSEEYLLQMPRVRGKKKQHDLYKEIYKLLPENYAAEKLPSDIFENIKNEFEQERTKDMRLLISSINQRAEKLNVNLQKNEQKIDSISQRVGSLIEKKSDIINSYKIKVTAIKDKKTSRERKDALLTELRGAHKAQLRSIDKALTKQRSQLNSLHDEVNFITEQQDFLNSIKDTELAGKQGLCRINLKWNTEDDLDLHLILPHGAIDSNDDIYYSNMKVEYNGGICSLDYDAIPSNPGENPQENIAWEHCLPDGKFKVAVKLYNKRSSLDKIPFSITVFAGRYIANEVFYFKKPYNKEIIEITTLTFKKGKVVTPIIFNTNKKGSINR